jgi:hypothetical protein
MEHLSSDMEQQNQVQWRRDKVPRNQAKESIKEYVTQHLPAQYQICLSALDTILKHAYEILETSDDNREKLQAMELQGYTLGMQ